jgi:hypothetical protein
MSRDAGTDEATGLTGPFGGSALSANGATEVHFPVAEIDANGVPRQIQHGPIIWRPQP